MVVKVSFVMFFPSHSVRGLASTPPPVVDLTNRCAIRSHTLVLTAIDIDDGALHPPGFLAAEKRYDFGNIAGLSQPRNADAPGRAAYVLLHIQTLLGSPFIEQLLPALSSHRAGLNEVHVNPILNTLFGD